MKYVWPILATLSYGLASTLAFSGVDIHVCVGFIALGLSFAVVVPKVGE